MDGRPTVFDMNGLRGSNFVMRDRLTGSDWQQGDGVAFAGPRTGQRLELIPFTITTWAEWRAQHPESLAFVVKPELVAQYTLMAGRQKDLMAFPLPVRDPLRQDGRLAPTAMVAGIEAGGAEKAYSLQFLSRQPVLNDRVGTLPVVLLYHAAARTHRAFARRSGARELTFAAVAGSPEITDRETGSRWNSHGKCVEGSLKGAQLEEVLLQPSFWFSWAQFHPNTQVVPGGN